VTPLINIREVTQPNHYSFGRIVIGDVRSLSIFYMPADIVDQVFNVIHVQLPGDCIDEVLLPRAAGRSGIIKEERATSVARGA
jgi:hypothetical protein